MKGAIVVCFLALAAVTLARPDQYTDKYDKIDVDGVLQSSRLLGSYVKCMLETGKCTAEGTELKNTIGDALQTDCSKCTRIQSERAMQVIKYLINEKPDVWDKLTAKYDPTGIYAKKHDAELKAAKQAS